MGGDGGAAPGGGAGSDGMESMPGLDEYQGPLPPPVADAKIAEGVQMLVGAMGFTDVAAVRAAVRAARGDVNLAVEFLSNGIPPSLQEDLDHATRAQPLSRQREQEQARAETQRALAMEMQMQLQETETGSMQVSGDMVSGDVSPAQVMALFERQE